MGQAKNTRAAFAVLIIALLALAALVFAATRINGMERTAAPQTTRERSPLAADPDIVIDPTPLPTPSLAEGPLVGMPFLNEDCAVELVLSNDGVTDAVVSIQVETTTGFDEHEDVVPAQGILTLTLIREDPVTYVYVVETSGAGDGIISWAPDYNECKDNSTTTPSTGGAGDSQQLERPSPEAPWTTEVEPPAALI